MKELTTPLGRKVYVFENVVSSEICQTFIKKLPKNGIATYITDQEVANSVYNLYNKYCAPNSIQFVGCTNKYTYGSSTKPILYHTDPHDKSTQQWKILLYLNSLSNAGTIFREGGKDITTECSEGTIVLFDTRIPHLGNPRQSSSDVKYTIGCFPLTEENQNYFSKKGSAMEMIWVKQKIYLSS